MINQKGRRHSADPLGPVSSSFGRSISAETRVAQAFLLLFRLITNSTVARLTLSPFPFQERNGEVTVENSIHFAHTQQFLFNAKLTLLVTLYHLRHSAYAIQDVPRTGQASQMGRQADRQGERARHLHSSGCVYGWPDRLTEMRPYRMVRQDLTLELN